MTPTALVTGASSGIGRELALGLARRGHDLTVVARRKPELEALAAEVRQLGRECRVLTADLSARGEVARLVAELGDVPDVVAANAGVGLAGPFAENDPARLEAMIELNAVSLALMARAVLPKMLTRNSGRLLLVGSVAGYLPGPGMAGYYATKAFVRSLAESLSHELRGTGVTVTHLAPGPVRTGFAEAASMGDSPLFKTPGTLSARAVADQAIRGLLKGKRTVVPGAANRVGLLAARLLPTGLVARVVAGVQERKRPREDQTKG